MLTPSNQSFVSVLVALFVGFFFAKIIDSLLVDPAERVTRDSTREYFRCMSRHPDLRNENSTWHAGPKKALQSCSNFDRLSTIVRNKDEDKRIILPANKAIGCVLVTLGVGQDTLAESQIKALLPNCKFFGADPIDEGNREKYEQIGAFFQTAIGATSRTESQLYKKGVYEEMAAVDSTPLYEFLRRRVQHKVIDFLLIDIEYSEYDILPLVQASRALFEGFVFCQINLEVHGARHQRHKAQFHAFVQQLLSEGIYVLASSDQLPEPYMHHRMFIYNHVAPACVGKYFSS